MVEEEKKYNIKKLYYRNHNKKVNCHILIAITWKMLYFLEYESFKLFFKLIILSFICSSVVRF